MEHNRLYSLTRGPQFYLLQIFVICCLVSLMTLYHLKICLCFQLNKGTEDCYWLHTSFKIHCRAEVFSRKCIRTDFCCINNIKILLSQGLSEFYCGERSLILHAFISSKYCLFDGGTYPSNVFAAPIFKPIVVIFIVPFNLFIHKSLQLTKYQIRKYIVISITWCEVKAKIMDDNLSTQQGI